MDELGAVFQRLATSSFRRSFELQSRELEYLQDRGLAVVLRQGEAFIRERLAPAAPLNDGNQTPFRGHPVFVAQHATATCCRGCLKKWHGIAAGRELTGDEIAYVLSVLSGWLESRSDTDARAEQASVQRELWERGTG